MFYTLELITLNLNLFHSKHVLCDVEIFPLVLYVEAFFIASTFVL
jgi:hypothetical protein